MPPQKLQALQRVLQSEFCNAVREVRWPYLNSTVYHLITLWITYIEIMLRQLTAVLILHFTGVWACVWNGGHQQQSRSQGQCYSQGKEDKLWGKFSKNGVIDFQVTLLTLSVGYCCSFCRKWRPLPSPRGGVAKDRGRPGVQYNGREGAELSHLHLPHHPRWYRWPPRWSEEGRSTPVCEWRGTFMHLSSDETRAKCMLL